MSDSTDAIELSTLVDRARALVPALKERAAKTDALGRIPDETMADLVDGGLLRCLQPRRFGGYELDYGCQLDLAAELGRGCGSTGWVAVLLACHPWLLGMFAPEAQEEVWGDDPDTLIATSWGVQQVEASAVDGGLQVRGHWKYSSGIDHCRWVQVFVPVPEEGGVCPTIALVPASDFRVERTWTAHGLSGTGSNDVVVDGAFVPEHRCLDMRTLKGGPTPGSALHDSHLYRLPLWTLFSFNLGAPILGIARGVYEEFVAQARGRHSAIFDVEMVELTTVQLRVAEADAEIEAAGALLRRNNLEVNRLGRAGETLPMEFRVRYRRDVSYAAMVCMRACDRLQAASGADAISRDNPIQRGFRDARAVNAQVALIFDANAVPFGRVALGLDPGDPRI